MFKKCFTLVIFVLCGCTFYKPSVKFMYTGEYGLVYEADSDGRRHTMGECYQLANETCFGKFEVLNKSERTFKTTSYGDDDEVDVSTGIDRTLLFYCKK